MFTIYPAIDIRGGKCVRLLQGDYAKETVYGDSPVEMAQSFAEKGSKWIHMVDLDGAKNGAAVNESLVLEAAKNVSAKVQIGGGIRSRETVQMYFEGGVSRVILGSSAIADPSFVKEVLREYGGDRIAIGIDARDGFVATHGWLKTSEVRAEQLAEELVQFGAETFIMTDIAKDGMLQGPNLEGIVSLSRKTGKKVIASGGVSTIEDIKQLAKYKDDGVCGAIIGKAIYTGGISLEEALQVVESR